MAQGMISDTPLACNKLVSFHLDLSQQPVILHGELQRSPSHPSRAFQVQIHNSSKLQLLMKSGYHLHHHPLMYRDDIAFLLVHNSSKRTDSHHILCVDVKNNRFLGFQPVRDLQKTGSVSSVEVFSAGVSKDRQYLALTVAVVTDQSYMYMSEAGHCYVILYDMNHWDMVMKIETGTFVTPSVAFDPTMPSTRPQMTIMYAENGSERPMLATYDVKSKRSVVRTPFVAMELDGDATTQLVYTVDGSYVILLVLEDMWHDKTSLARLFAIRSSSLMLHHRYPASTVRPCHPECVFALVPFVQQCGTRFVVQRTRINEEITDQTYRVPPSLQKLTALCRSVVLQTLSERSKVHGLPLPLEVKRYMLYQGE